LSFKTKKILFKVSVSNPDFEAVILYGPPGLKEENLKSPSVVTFLTEPVGMCVIVTVTSEALTSPEIDEVVSAYAKVTKKTVKSE
jgi:hypothetical protein